MIRNNPNIKRVVVRNTEFKISQFADDTTCFQPSLPHSDSLITEVFFFLLWSALELRKIGHGPDWSQTIPQVLTAEDTLKAKGKNLGGVVLEESLRGRTLHLLDRMRRTCSLWNNRALSLKGKVTVFNALVSSQMQYISMTTATPSKVITKTVQNSSK